MNSCLFQRRFRRTNYNYRHAAASLARAQSLENILAAFARQIQIQKDQRWGRGFQIPIHVVNEANGFFTFVRRPQLERRELPIQSHTHQQSVGFVILKKKNQGCRRFV